MLPPMHESISYPSKESFSLCSRGSNSVNTSVFHTSLPEKSIPIARLLFGVLALFFLASAQADTDQAYRLPAGIVPGFQQIFLNLDPDQTEYSGSTAIQITVTKATDRIGFYQSELKLDSVEVKSGDHVRKLSTESAEYQITWAADGKPFEPGDYVLEIDFSGQLATNALGMYQTAYEGNHYIYTQFEVMNARRAFPSFPYSRRKRVRPRPRAFRPSCRMP